MAKDVYPLYIIRKHSDRVVNYISSNIPDNHYIVIDNPEITIGLDYEIVLNLLYHDYRDMGDIEDSYDINEIIGEFGKEKLQLTIFNNELAEKLNEYRKELITKIFRKTLSSIVDNVNEILEYLEDTVDIDIEIILIRLENRRYILLHKRYTKDIEKLLE